MQGKTKMWDTLIAKIKGNKKLEDSNICSAGPGRGAYICIYNYTQKP